MALMFWPPSCVPIEFASCCGDRADAVGDLFDLVEDLPGRRLLGDRVDLVAVLQLAPVGRARREDDDRLAEERRALFPSVAFS